MPSCATNDGELVASHYAVLLDERDDGQLGVVFHVGRPDDQVHGFGTDEMLLIVAGPHGYVSLEALRRPGTYQQPALADDTERALAAE